MKRKMTGPGPKRWSQRLRETIRGTKSVRSSFSEPVDISDKTQSPTHSPTTEGQPPIEPEQASVDINVDVNVEASTPETEVPGEGTSATPYSNPRFAREAAEDRYLKWYSKRAVLCERGINLEDYSAPPYELVDMINRRGWTDWVVVSQKAVVPLVREFYSNAVKGEKGKIEITTKVRNKEIRLVPESIVMYAGLPFGQPLVINLEQQARWIEQLKKENLVKLLSGNPQAQWKGVRLSKGDLTDKSKVLHMLVCSKILPHAYVSSVTLPQAEMIGRLLLDIPIDLTKHIWNMITGAIAKPEVNSGLPFGGLITKILQSHGVKGKSGMEMVKPATRIAKTSMKRSRGQLARKVAVEPQQEQQSEGQSGTEKVTLQSLYALVKEVKDQQVELAAELKKLKDKQDADHQQTIQMLEGLYAPAAPEDYVIPPDH